MQNNEQDKKVQEARAKLAEKFGDVTRSGGKGSERRKKKVAPKNQVNDDKKLKNAIKKFNVHPLPEIGEVNMFKDDGTVVQFKNPEVLASVPSNTFVISGKHDTRKIKDVLPEVLTHLGPKQLSELKDLTKGKVPEGIKEADNEEDDEVPNLVNENFEKAGESK